MPSIKVSRVISVIAYVHSRVSAGTNCCPVVLNLVPIALPNKP
jgi:hypothetical protein